MPTDNGEAVARLEFLQRYLDDKAAGQLRSLAEYQAEFHPYEDAIASEFARVEADATVQQSVPSEFKVFVRGVNGRQLGKYILVKEIGRGGQAVVFLAHDTSVGRRVALKIFDRLTPGDDERFRWFWREAEATSRIEHASICPVYEVSTDEVPFIAMRFIEGQTLAQVIAARHGPPSSEALKNALRIIERAARALHVAHEAGFVHRDVKPANIMVEADGGPVILDFGLARDVEGPTQTKSGDFFGTPAYMSPEQLAHNRIRLDGRTDVFSLGSTLYEFLTSKRPFDAPTREGLFQAIMTKEPDNPRRLNLALQKNVCTVLRTALEKDRDKRYQSAAAFADDLSSVIGGRKPRARPVGVVGRMLRWARREPAKAILVLVLMMALPTIATLSTLWLKDRTKAEEARLADVAKRRDETLAEASYELNVGDLRCALRLFEKALALEGTSRDAVAGMVFARLGLCEPDLALHTLNAHSELIGKGCGAMLLRAAVLEDLGRRREADLLENTAPPPREVLDYHILAKRESRRGHRGDDSAFDRALRYASHGVILSRSPHLHLFILRTYVAAKANNRDAVIETTDALTAHWPQSASAHFLRAWALKEIGDASLLVEIIDAFNESIRLNPSCAEAYSNLGNALQESGRLEEALIAHDRAVSLKPNNAKIYSNYGNALYAAGRLDDALDAYQKAVNIGQDGDGYYNIGVIFRDKGMIEQAINAWQESISNGGSSAVEARCALGAALRDNGQYEEAIEAYRQAIDAAPDSARPRNDLGLVFLQMGLVEQAIETLREAAVRDPRFAIVHANLGVALSKGGLIDEAIDSYRKAISLDRDLAVAYANLSVALRKKGLIDEAVDAARKAADRDDSSESRINLGLALEDKGMWDAAADEYQRAIVTDRTNASAYGGLGSVLWRTGRYAESAAKLRIALTQRCDSQVRSKVTSMLSTVASLAAEDELLSERFDDLVAAGIDPDDDALDFARLALHHDRTTLSSRWYALAFMRDPAAASVGQPHRERAIAAQIRAGTGDDEDATDYKTRASLRATALTWLWADISVWNDRLDDGRATERKVRWTLERWRTCRGFAGVRGEAMRKLTPEERKQWEAFWDQVGENIEELR